VGAGVSGLACAAALAPARRRVAVLERARGVGGRCATRRLDGVPFDHGVAFLHGTDPAFLAALAAVPATRLDGWPRRVEGTGRPCQPEAFRPGERRFAFVEGVSAFPKHLAAGLDVRLEVEVRGLAAAEGGVRLGVADGAVEAPVVVLALAAEQSLGLLAALPAAPPEVNAARALLQTARSQPCLSLLALYPPGVAGPAWDAAYPESSQVLQVISNETSKRADAGGGGRTALVLQAHAAWSRERLRSASWPDELLEEAAHLLGPWAGLPAATYAQRWSYARLDRSAELSGPMLLGLPGGGRLGLCGDRFAPGGGVQAAFGSGRMMAGRILAGETA
jgi:predicted NAD/FAD-dependent oxidoreductase